MTPASVLVEGPEDAGRSGPGSAMRDAFPLLVGVGLLMAGNGLTGTLLGVRAGIEGFGPTVTGVVLAGYYVGFLGGSLAVPGVISRVGHVRAFAGLASLASAVVLIHVIQREPVSWFALRAVSGLCISGLYVVIETWLNGAATNRIRGGLLATYMVVVTGGVLAGQALFAVANPRGFAVFVLASVLVSLAVVPVSLATVRAPDVPTPDPLSLRSLIDVAPLAAVGGALAGFTGAAMLGAGAIYGVESGLGPRGTAALIAAALAGGLVLQVPLGRLSDRTDRRLVIAASAGTAAVGAVAAALIAPGSPGIVVVLTLIAGGMSFPLYSLSNAHLNDWLDEGRVVAAGARMVLVNGMGSIAGPITGAAAIELAGPEGLFMVLAAGYATVALYAAYRMTRRPPVPEAERSEFVAYPAGAGLTVATLAEGVGDELYPATKGEFDVGGEPMTYQEQGGGLPIVLVHAAGDEPGTWEATRSALAVDGARVIVPDLRDVEAAVDRQLDDLLAVLRELELPEATFVGYGAAGEVVERLGAEHPDRVAAMVVVGDEHAGDGAVEEGVPVLRVAAPSGDSPHIEDPEGFADTVIEFLRHR